MKKFVYVTIALVFALSLFVAQSATAVKAADDNGSTVGALVNVNCRSGPSLFNKILGTLKAETFANVVGVAENNKKQYFLIQLNKTTQCWVIGSSVTFYGDLDMVPVVTSFPKPDILANGLTDWSGNWTIRYQTDADGNSIDVPVKFVQDGFTLHFSYVTTDKTYYWSGIISADGKKVTGSINDRKFTLYRVLTNRNQFRGEWVNAERSDMSGEFCGGKTWLPDPCRP